MERYSEYAPITGVKRGTKAQMPPTETKVVQIVHAKSLEFHVAKRAGTVYEAGESVKQWQGSAVQ